MIRRIFIVALLSGPFFLLAQQSTLLTGRISNGEASTVELVADPLFLNSGSSQSTTPVEDRFQFDLKLSQPLAVTLMAGDRRVSLFLVPGENLDMNLDLSSESAQALELSGKGASYNRFLQQFLSEHGAPFDVAAMNTSLLGTTVDLLELDLYERRSKMQKALEIGFKDSDYPQSFRDHLTAEVAYFYDRWLLAYPIVRAESNPKSLEVKHLPRIIQQGFDASKLVNQNALGSPVYRDYVWYYLTYFTSEQNGFAKFTDHNKSLIAKFDYAAAHLKGRVLTWYVSKLLADNCDKVAPGTVERLRAGIRKEDGAAEYLKAVEVICKEAQAAKVAEASTDDKSAKNSKNNKSNPKMSDEKYDFRMVSLDGKEMKLSDFQGKVVYIDYWASWCGPCRAQMPFSKKLHHRLEDELPKKEAKDIVFLYISIDQDEAAWRKGIEAMSIEGTHAFSNARWPDGAGNYFQIPGIPRYMIMNKAGEIVDMNAPRPSMDGVFEQLKKLVEE